MIRAAALALCLMAGPLQAAGVAEQAQGAAASLREAITDMRSARDGRDRVGALTRTITAYEDGLTALREGLRQVSAREADLRAQAEGRDRDISQLLGALARMDTTPGPMLFLHPGGPLATVRTGLIMADVTPALQAEADDLRRQLEELGRLRAARLEASGTLAEGLRVAQEARIALSQAISDRTDLPRRFTEDPGVLRALLESSETLDSFAAQLDPEGMPPGFAEAKGTLPLPAHGTLVRRANQPDAAGVRRPGIIFVTRPAALVTAPVAATIRYRGPLSGYGNVMILEPGDGYLMVLAGLQTVYGEVGEVVPAGAALGLMPGGDQGLVNVLDQAADAPGSGETETLYLELRRGTGPVDPAEWFAELRET
ncbi:murein hydrolase activator EnvC family protein [Falsirhodobacter algicola]|uniref:Peptidoglycan DD-metalloendopeptidase family protein n=1 Tax=Falsirhodobacter algicola TaxID=2692330 RepID=A0A8J8MTH1_9RHOB|nr:peptidoglycan DD-metalloendopeptidase family protein [Falsirhodobacter algicola]QUS36111.1 peptidoglycan DD-metalloendopeptidase family protein [Falsirhodobacter algicola]